MAGEKLTVVACGAIREIYLVTITMDVISLASLSRRIDQIQGDRTLEQLTIEH